MNYKTIDPSSHIANFEAGFCFFLHLLRYGKVTNSDKEMMKYWRTNEVREIIRTIIEKHADIRIFECENIIYILPEPDSELFGYSNDLIRKGMSLKTNTELYTAYFVILCLLSIFFNGESFINTRQFVPIAELERFISTHTKEILDADVESLNKAEAQTGLTLYSIAAYWENLDPFDPAIKSLSRATKNRISFILRVCRFFESEGLLQVDEGLVEVLEESEIRLKYKIIHAVENEFFHIQRKSEILEKLKSSLIRSV